MTRLYRSRTDRKIAGVCGGLGQMLDVDPNLVRIAFVLLAVVTGFIPMLVAYVAAWLLVPYEGAADVTVHHPESKTGDARRHSAA
jgi:phage shock protein C